MFTKYQWGGNMEQQMQLIGQQFSASEIDAIITALERSISCCEERIEYLSENGLPFGYESMCFERFRSVLSRARVVSRSLFSDAVSGRRGYRDRV